MAATDQDVLSRSSSTSHTIQEDQKRTSKNPDRPSSDIDEKHSQSHLTETFATKQLTTDEKHSNDDNDITDDKDKKKKDGKKKKEKKKAVPLYRLFRFATPRDLFMIFVAIICSAGIGAIQPVTIVIFGDLLGSISSTAMTNPSAMLDVSMNLILIFVYMGTAVLVAAYCANCFWVLTGENQTRRIRTMYVHAILRQDMGWFDKAEEGSLTTRLATDTQLIQDGISEKFGLFITAIAQFISGFVVAFVKGWQLAVIMLATMPILAGTGGAMGYFITKYTLKTQTSYAEAGAVAEQVFAGIRTVYSFSLQERFARRYDQSLEKAAATGIKRGAILGFGFGGFMFVLFCTYGLAFWYGAKLTMQGEIEGPTVMVVFFAMIMGAIALLQLPPNLSAVSSAAGAAYKIFETIDRVPDIDPDSTEGIIPEKLEGEIEFRNVQFKYPTRPDITILKDLTLKIRPGMTVAFVGPSGSGKSTSVQLVQRFYDPLAGQVLLDGRDLKSLNVKWLRDQIGVVSQEPVLFNMTIRQNLLMGVQREVTPEEIVDACKKANCHMFISQLPNGYDTLVGEHGGMMSGGQKQRIAIARAILKNPSILLLDEATSALDTQSERLVQKALDAAAANRTTIVIAHRLSTIRNADLIVVMQQGDLIEQGTHNELLALNGVYADLVRKQEIATKQVGHQEEEIDDEELLLKETVQLKEEVEAVENIQVIAEKAPSLDLAKVTSRSSVDAFQLKLKKEKEEKKLAKKQKAPIGKVLRQMRPEWPLLALGVAGAAIAGAVFPCFALILAQVINILIMSADPSRRSAIAPGPMQGANLYAFLFVVVAIAALFGFATQVISFETAGERYTKRLRGAIFRAYMRQEIGYFDEEEHSLGALTSKLAIDAKNVNEMVTKTWGDITQIIVTGIVGLVIAFVHSWTLTLIILCMAPFIMFATGYESKIHRGFEDVTKKANEQSGEVAGEAIKEIRTVCALNKQPFFEGKYYKATDHPHKLARRKAITASLGYGLHQGITVYTNAVAFYAGIRLMSDGKIDFLQMFTTMMTIMITAQSVGRASVFTQTFAKAKFSSLAAFAVLERVPSIDPDLEGIETEKVKGEVDFKDITFRYPSRPDVPIFSGEFNLHGKAGTTIALVGPSGCGKSTTIGMLQRWYDPLDGTVRLDDHNVKAFSVNNLRSHMALVGQEPVLFDMSIGDNIRFGVDEHKTITQDDVEAACKAANIHNFIIGLPQGYDTRVGDKGSQLSGGQKQRIAIARALIRKPKILLLDEATSALDSESEKLVQAAIDNILEEGGRTTITIAHRLSTIQNADLICVVKNGRVIEQGTHWELLKLNGTYSELVHQQSLNAN
ncbi:P-loop containing nucleoside triphosphate hydrolase protein [Radiomyces spectabilis]|uniref:P-loop containing nucleoside triphosphate hydrolase protein n=1 Tax=Radiomyces spectabilis TaxID=64574 RepID=UPI002220E639|nr:P-loop containing nucleoside triphosphate hydrolase protein [Radiomyces spectabilis]KAI8381003.1 P-loop containing nucleoside triphosphate hydrolase protein [Radiomyces spectabilis]